MVLAVEWLQYNSVKTKALLKTTMITLNTVLYLDQCVVYFCY